MENVSRPDGRAEPGSSPPTDPWQAHPIRVTGSLRRFRPGSAAALVLAVVALQRCASAPSRPAGRTVVVSLDGVGGVRLNALLAAGNLRAGGYSAFAERGLLAGRAIDVTPSLTPSAHISAITGVSPARTGIVSHYFFEPGTPFGRMADGFTADIQAETLWEAASRQGKRVGVILYPGADGRNARRRGDFGVIWPEKAAKTSVFKDVPASDWVDAPTSVRTFSPGRQARVSIGTPGGGALILRLLAVDTTDDGRVDYDAIRIARTEDASDATLGVVSAKGWFPLAVQGPGGARFTTWCRLADLAPDLSRVVIYVGAFHELEAYPESFRSKLEAEAGGWPGPPDAAFLTRAGHLDDDAHEEQAARLAAYLTKVLVLTIRTESWDLLLGYQPLVDEMEHAFEAGPNGGSRERVERAFQTVDRSVADVLAALSPRDTIVVLSDHGIVPLTAAVNIDRFFRDRGWTIAGENDGLPASARRVQVNAGSGIAHLYVDPALPPVARDEAAAALLGDARGLPPEVVDEVVPRRDLARVGLDNPRSGDVVVLLKPGVEFSRSHPEVLGRAHQRGGHGYRVGTPALDAAFMALGPGIGRSRPPTVSILDVAGVAARALGIEPPSPGRVSR